MEKIDRFRGDHYFLSNFFEAPVEYGGLSYRSSEAAYQAQKCADPDERIRFTAMSSAVSKEASLSIDIRDDWENVRVDVMTKIVRCKFTQNPELADLLILTGDAYLEEGNTWGDTFWGFPKERARTISVKS